MKNYDTLVRSLVNENFFYFLALITIDRFQSRKKRKNTIVIRQDVMSFGNWYFNCIPLSPLPLYMYIIFRQTRLIIAWIEDRSRRKESRINENENIDADSLENIFITSLNSHDCINIFNYISFDEYKERITIVWNLRITRSMKIYL